MSEKNKNDYLLEEEKEVHLKEVFEKYIFYWKWFALGLLVALLLAFLYLRVTPNQYKVSSTILINDEKEGGLTSELSAFEDLGLISGTQTSIETEVGILRSRSLLTRVLKDLRLNTTYFYKERLGETELFQSSLPFHLNFTIKDSLFYEKDTMFSISATSNLDFNLLNGDGDVVSNHKFGENIISTISDFIITPKNLDDVPIEKQYNIYINPLDNIVEYYRDRILIEPYDKKSSLIILTLHDPMKQKAIAILNNLIKQYNLDAVDDKSMVAKKTNQFINERLSVISEDLALVDKGVEDFKTKNKLTSIASEASIILDSNSELEKRIVNISTQLKLVDFVQEHIENNSEDLIPSNIGIADYDLSNSTETYNEILLERNRIKKSSGELNPVIINLNDQIDNLRANIVQSLMNFKSSLTISLNELKSQENKLSSKIKSVPKQEREYRDIQRQQQIIETLYLYLLEKREENAISLAVTVPNAKIIDRAYGNNNPVSPQPKLIYLIAFLLGLIVPFIIIYIISLFDYRVHSIEDVEEVVKAPVLGNIPRGDKNKDLIVLENDRSPLTEAFRMLRTNVHFILSKVKTDSKSIFVTSTTTGEGKTFTAINLARVLALSNKKVLLIGADIRNPKLAKILGVQESRGLTHYLMNDKLKPSELIEYHDAHKIDIMLSGAIVPNPSELLMNGRFETLLAFGNENYDFVIVDTSSIHLVTDTLLMNQNKVDLFIYVIRANYLDKRMLKIPEKLYNSNRLQNMAILLNDTKIGGYGYGYKNGWSWPGKIKQPFL